VTLPKYAYFEGKIVPYSEAKVGVMNHTLNYGTGAFAGIRAYWNPDREQLYVFRPIDHYKRLLKSVRLLQADLDYTPEALRDINLELIRMEGLREDCYIRPLIYNADEIIGVRLHDLDTKITMFTIPFTRYIEKDEGAHVTISSWRRIDDNAIPARGKITGAYINSAYIKTTAVRAGFDEALVLSNDGHISEGSAMNIFMVRDGLLITPPVTENILEGITRRTGTAAAVTAVIRVDYQDIGSGSMGPITKQLRELYDDLVRGKLEAYSDWNEPVYVSETVTTK
jgi:branched-chain amino acid aminotransferase